MISSNINIVLIYLKFYCIILGKILRYYYFLTYILKFNYVIIDKINLNEFS